MHFKFCDLVFRVFIFAHRRVRIQQREQAEAAAEKNVDEKAAAKEPWAGKGKGKVVVAKKPAAPTAGNNADENEVAGGDID